MNREQVKELLQMIYYSYSRFEVSTEKIDMWQRMLSNQNPATVMRKAEKHIVSEKYPPSIADIYTQPMQKSYEQLQHEKAMAEQERLLAEERKRKND